MTGALFGLQSAYIANQSVFAIVKVNGTLCCRRELCIIVIVAAFFFLLSFLYREDKAIIHNCPQPT